MAKTLTKLLAAGIITAGSLFGLGNCATMITEEKPAREFPEGHIHGVEFSSIKQDKVPYKLEEQVMYNERQYFQEREKTAETLPMEVFVYKDVTRELDLDSKKIELLPKRKYIPRLDEGNYSKDKWTDWVTLMNEGPYGLRAHMLSSEQLKNLSKNSKNEVGYSVVTTDNGAAFAIKTIKILGEEYFFPHVKENETNEKGKLNYYLIPVKGAKIRIDNKCGNISIYNENNIFRPIDPEVFPELFKDTRIQIQKKAGN